MGVPTQNTYPTPNTVYASALDVGMTISPTGQPGGIIRTCKLRAAYVDPDTGVWTDCNVAKTLSNVSFGFDSSGNPTGLPPDLATLAPQILATWTAIATTIAAINAIRKLV